MVQSGGGPTTLRIHGVPGEMTADSLVALLSVMAPGKFDFAPWNQNMLSLRLQVHKDDDRRFPKPLYLQENSLIFGTASP